MGEELNLVERLAFRASLENSHQGTSEQIDGPRLLANCASYPEFLSVLGDVDIAVRWIVLSSHFLLGLFCTCEPKCFSGIGF